MARDFSVGRDLGDAKDAFIFGPRHVVRLQDGPLDPRRPLGGLLRDERTATQRCYANHRRSAKPNTFEHVVLPAVVDFPDGGVPASGKQAELRCWRARWSFSTLVTLQESSMTQVKLAARFEALVCQGD